MARARILIVDEDLDAAELVRTDLEAAGHDVAVAVDGDGALPLLVDTPPDVVLLDLTTADRDGWRVLAELQGEPSLVDVAVVVLATTRSAGDQRTLLHGAVRCLDKPLARDRVLRTIDEVTVPAPAHVRADRRVQLRGLLDRIEMVGRRPTSGPRAR